MYESKLVKIGRITMLFAIVANFLPAIYVGIRYGGSSITNGVSS